MMDQMVQLEHDSLLFAMLYKPSWISESCFYFQVVIGRAQVSIEKRNQSYETLVRLPNLGQPWREREKIINYYYNHILKIRERVNSPFQTKNVIQNTVSRFQNLFPSQSPSLVKPNLKYEFIIIWVLFKSLVI